MNKDKLFKYFITTKLKGKATRSGDLGEYICLTDTHMIAVFKASECLLDPTKFNPLESTTLFKDLLDDKDTKLAKITGVQKQLDKITAIEIKADGEKSIWVDKKLLDLLYDKKNPTEFHVKSPKAPVTLLENGEVIGCILPLHIKEDE